MQDNGRARRVGEQIQRELALILQRDFKDPRAQWVTVSAVHVTRDFAHAKVFVTVLNKTDDIQQELDILNQANKFFRRELGNRMRLRSIPQLHFVYDESIERGSRLTRLIEDAVAKDSSGSSS